jgi:hypothetical protein
LKTLQQTFEDDNSTLVTYVNTGGNVPLSGTLTGFDMFEWEIPLALNYIKNSPNPSDPLTTIRSDIPFATSGPVDAKVVIYDTLGLVTKTLYQGKLETGRYKIQ